MKLGAIAPWFGGKRTLAPVIVEALGAHKSYIEPFCGSMAVLMAKEPAGYETVNDLHGDLVNLAWCLQHPRLAEDLYERMGRTLVCEGLMEEWRAVVDQPIDTAGGADVDRAHAYLALAWMGRNGTSGLERQNFQIAVRWTPTGGSATTRFRSATESIPAWHERLRNVVILRRDGFKVIQSVADRADTAIYCDPPYLRDTRSGSNSDYLHDFKEPEHLMLRDLLARFERTRVVISYYDSPSLRELYGGGRWRIISVEASKMLSRQNRRGAADDAAPEVLIVNFDEPSPFNRAVDVVGAVPITQADAIRGEVPGVDQVVDGEPVMELF